MKTGVLRADFIITNKYRDHSLDIITDNTGLIDWDVRMTDWISRNNWYYTGWEPINYFRNTRNSILNTCCYLDLMHFFNYCFVMHLKSYYIQTSNHAYNIAIIILQWLRDASHAHCNNVRFQITKINCSNNCSVQHKFWNSTVPATIYMYTCGKQLHTYPELNKETIMYKLHTSARLLYLLLLQAACSTY